jgi:hypothetical protein
MNTPFNRYLYGGFVVLAVVMLTTGNWMTGVSNIGIALLFDPFDTKQPFNGNRYGLSCTYACCSRRWDMDYTQRYKPLTQMPSIQFALLGLDVRITARRRIRH